jgi:glycerophosphoryl diester phosphodiesterase
MPARVSYWLNRLADEIDPAQYRFWRIGHRGARAHAPDNTLQSFRKAAELGADFVELDVQRTADGQIAVIHDAHLTDRDGRILLVRTSALAELQEVDLGEGERVPSLQEALDVCQERTMGAYIEIKDGGILWALATLLGDHDWGRHCLCGSFRPDWLAELKLLAPDLSTSILFGSAHVDAVQLAQSIGADYVHPCWERHGRPDALLTPEWMSRVREAGLGVICWHEERPEVIAALRQIGVDGICSDAPELLLEGKSE